MYPAKKDVSGTAYLHGREAEFTRLGAPAPPRRLDFSWWLKPPKPLILHHVGESRYGRYGSFIPLKINEILDHEPRANSRYRSGTDGFIRHRAGRRFERVQKYSSGVKEGTATLKMLLNGGLQEDCGACARPGLQEEKNEGTAPNKNRPSSAGYPLLKSSATS